MRHTDREERDPSGKLDQDNTEGQSTMGTDSAEGNLAVKVDTAFGSNSYGWFYTIITGTIYRYYIGTGSQIGTVYVVLMVIYVYCLPVLYNCTGTIYFSLLL